MSESGHISIHAENILPIIKRWLYSEKEIFIRELVANAADAIHKLSKIAILDTPSRPIPDAKITVAIDKSAKTVTITDTGLGMTADEIKRYINQVAFSGVKDFLEKYQDKGDEQQIIGHFGLGFYSSYMVAHKVEIDTLSYQPDSAAAHWVCDGSTEFTLSPSERQTVGTTITLHIAEDSLDMLEEGTLRGLLNKYCAFIKYPIELAGQTVNDPRPIWTRSPTELTDKDYLDLFHKLFPACPDPLFWIHLNVDHPFNLKGVLYFPKLRHELSAAEGEVKLYCNQVYVADNCKELIPEFLTLLKGAIDCPDLPLNVSRSYLQNDPTVQRIAGHIVKKVADKLTGMAKTDLDHYKKYWDDIHPFVKFGMLKDQKFYERMIEHLLCKTTGGDYLTLDQYLEKNKDKVDGTIFYTSDEHAQANLIRLLTSEEIPVIVANTVIDTHFLPYVEMQSGRKYKFMRVDADVSKHLIHSGATIVDPTDHKTASEKLDEIFRKNLSRPKIKVKIENLKSPDIPGLLIVDEHMRRLQQMARMSQFDSGGTFEEEQTLVVNQNNPAIKKLLQLSKSFNREADVKLLVDHIYDLAYLQQGKFTADMMQQFITRSSAIIERLGASS